MYKVKSTEYNIPDEKFGRELTFAVISDLHSREGSDVKQIIDILAAARPSFILAPGDIFERLDGTGAEKMEAGLELLSASAEIAPTFYSFGNHEDGGTRSWDKLKWSKIQSMRRYYAPEQLQKIADCGVQILDDGFIRQDGILFGGLCSGLINEGHLPNTAWLDEFCAQEGAKILLCHHPEYYEQYLRDRDIDLIVSGHAHGGQWRFFGRGVFAPGQGIFPKYTSGVHESRLVISRGLKPSGKIPRIFNTPEVVFVSVGTRGCGEDS